MSAVSAVTAPGVPGAPWSSWRRSEVPELHLMAEAPPRVDVPLHAYMEFGEKGKIIVIILCKQYTTSPNASDCMAMAASVHVFIKMLIIATAFI